MKQLFRLLVCVCCALPSQAQHTTSFQAIDLYGTSQITLAQVQEKFGLELAQFAAAFLKRDREKFGPLHDQLTNGIRGLGKFAYVSLSMIQYFSEGNPVYLTIDVVDEADRATRLDFLPAPTGEYADPDGALALWEEYQSKGFELQRKQELQFKPDDPCPAFHCVFRFTHPELQKYAALLTAKAAQHKDRLIEILHKDKDAGHRAAAAFVLAHIKDGDELVRAMLPALRDPSSSVRNNAMRVLAEIAQRHKTVAIPLAPILQAVQFPETTDRNKSLYILSGLADTPAPRAAIIQQAGPVLLKALRLQQPNNHDPAYATLKKISGQNFGERDYQAWEDWFSKQRTSPGPPAAKPSLQERRGKDGSSGIQGNGIQ